MSDTESIVDVACHDSETNIEIFSWKKDSWLLSFVTLRCLLLSRDKKAGS